MMPMMPYDDNDDEARGQTHDAHQANVHPSALPLDGEVTEADIDAQSWRSSVGGGVPYQLPWC